jgi:hypothetical protein
LANLKRAINRVSEQLQLGEDFQVRLLIDSAITAFQLENMALDNQNYATRLYEVGKYQ